METFDVIVVGTGGVGSAALYHLARRGLRTLGIDRFSVAHDRGSSHGHTRVIRQVHFEHPDYVPLALAAWDLWQELESEVSQHLLYPVGLLQVGPHRGQVIPAVLESAERYGLALEEMNSEVASQRFAPLRIPSGHLAVFEEKAGYLLVEACVRGHITAAKKQGAVLSCGQRVVDWQFHGDHCRVSTETETFVGRNLVIAPGADAARLCKLPTPEFRVLRKHVYWFDVGAARLAALGNVPIYLLESDRGVFYGFPPINGRGIKVAQHSGGQMITGDAFTAAREIDVEDLQAVTEFLQETLGCDQPIRTDHSVCWYTMTPNESFRVGRHPEYEHVFLACGLSGHGFKFTPVLGDALAQWVTQGHTDYELDFLAP